MHKQTVPRGFAPFTDLELPRLVALALANLHWKMNRLWRFRHTPNPSEILNQTVLYTLRKWQHERVTTEFNLLKIFEFSQGNFHYKEPFMGFRQFIQIVHANWMILGNYGVWEIYNWETNDWPHRP